MNLVKWNDYGVKQRDAQIMLAILCAEKLLPIYEADCIGDDTPHKAIAVAKKYVQAKDSSERAMVEAEAKLAMADVGAVRNRYGIGAEIANVVWHTLKAVVYPKRTAESSSYAKHFASQIIDRAGVICARLGEANRYATDFDELARQAVAIIEDK